VVNGAVNDAVNRIEQHYLLFKEDSYIPIMEA